MPVSEAPTAVPAALRTSLSRGIFEEACVLPCVTPLMDAKNSTV